MDYNDELMHYGVKGMKWGVRRYQNYDGSYTQRGLQRYKKTEADYDSAKKALDSAKNSGNESDIKRAKKNLRTAKAQMSKAYGRLKNDKRADQGKKLYAQGKTITGNNFKNRRAQVGLFIGASVADQMVGRALNNRRAVLITKKYGAIPMSKISRATIGVGSTAASVMIYAKTASENKKLRAYYAHSRRG